MLAKVYRRAAELVAQGWWQTALSSEDGDQVCLVQAMWTASRQLHGRNVTARDWRPLQLVLSRRGWASGYADWNDVPGRTQDEVEAALLEAARLASD